MRHFLPLLVISAFIPGVPNMLRATDRPRQPDVAELLEDQAEGLLKQLTGGPGNGQVEKSVVYSGKESIKIIPMQRYERAIPGWKYHIVEKPKAGEYRYLRLAWRADGCRGIMIQLHDEKDWNIRYTAGLDTQGWGTRFVADKPPPEWTVLTVDLFKDFGERTIQGIALTAFDGQAGYFDHIYFGRTVEDLDRIDATGLRGNKPAELTADQLERFWDDLAGQDAAKSYLALWSLVASPKQTVPFLGGKLRAAPATASAKQVEQWIRELDDNKFSRREAAFKRLEDHIEAAAALLEQALTGRPSPEMRSRVERLLAGRKNVEGRQAQIEKAIRTLEYTETPEARKSLEELAKSGDGARLQAAASAALKRLDATTGK